MRDDADESPLSTALAQAAENPDFHERSLAWSPTPWFHPPVPVAGDEPLLDEPSEMVEAMRRAGLA